MQLLMHRFFRISIAGLILLVSAAGIVTLFMPMIPFMFSCSSYYYETAPYTSDWKALGYDYVLEADPCMERVFAKPIVAFYAYEFPGRYEGADAPSGLVALGLAARILLVGLMVGGAVVLVFSVPLKLTKGQRAKVTWLWLAAISSSVFVGLICYNVLYDFFSVNWSSELTGCSGGEVLYFHEQMSPLAAVFYACIYEVTHFATLYTVDIYGALMFCIVSGAFLLANVSYHFTRDRLRILS